MRASVGDRLIIRGVHLGDPERDGEVVGVEGPDGAPPWRVRWETDGHVSLFFPGPDVTVRHLEHAAARQEHGEP